MACMVVPPTNSVAFALYVTMQFFCSLFDFIKKCWMTLMMCVFFIPLLPPTCNICFMEFICVNFSNA